MSKLRKTYVVNLYGAPGAGKTIIGSGLHYKLGMMSYDTEIVKEWVKREVWKKTSPQLADKLDKDEILEHNLQLSFNDFQIIGEQQNLEYDHYNKLDFIVTDSPLLLNVYYAQKRDPINNFLPMAQSFMNKARHDNVEYINFFIHRDPAASFNQQGRVHNETETKEIEKDLKNWLFSLGEKLEDIYGTGEERLENLLKSTLKKTFEK